MDVLTLARPGGSPVPIVDADLCGGCGACLLTCARSATRAVGAGTGPARIVIVPDRCDGCWECVEVCPAGAIGDRESDWR